MYLIDTNIILEWLLGQEKGTECRLLFSRFSNTNIPINLTRFSLYSIEVILFQKNATDILNTFLTAISNFSIFNLYSTTIAEEKKIISISNQYSLDFDDALHYFIAKEHNLQLISLDKHFDKTDIRRIEPQDIVGIK